MAEEEFQCKCWRRVQVNSGCKSATAGLARGTEKMKERIGGLMKSDIGILMLLALLSVAVHTATNGQYGFHRDELQTLDDARHLDWGSSRTRRLRR